MSSHLHPVSEQKASVPIKEKYKEIKDVFSIEIIPLFFQYLANFEEYFIYTFERMKKNVSHKNFYDSYTEAIKFSHDAVSSIYVPSSSMKELVLRLSEEEKHDLLKTTRDLEDITAKLLILSVGLRENIKGVFVGLTKLDESVPFGSIYLQEEKSSQMQSPAEASDIQEASTMLAPLFGSQAIKISHIPDFFQYTSIDMENLVKTEKYLEQRVSLEHVALRAVSNLPYPLGGSYQETMKLAGSKPHFKELFYFLVETFPSSFPRLLFTIAVMKRALE